MEIRGRMELTSLNFLTLAVGVAWVFLTAMAELISTEAQGKHIPALFTHA